MEVKKCTKCGAVKSAEEFYIHRNGKLRQWCKECCNSDTEHWDYCNCKTCKAKKLQAFRDIQNMLKGGA